MTSITEKAPQIAKLWHPVLNGVILASEVPSGRKTNYWWQCSLGHEWQARPADMCRYPDSSPCPFCIGRRVLLGFNDLASQSPDSAEEWHPTLNGELTPKEVTSGSNKTVWWLGKCGHEWQDIICEKTRKKKSCKICSNSQILIGFNDLDSQYPEIARLWHPTKNVLSTQDVLPGTKVYYWWLGKCGHEWETSPCRMTDLDKGASGCPYCCGKKVLIGFNDLQSTFPDIAIDWHPTKNGDTTPFDYTYGSGKKVWWKDNKCGHEWNTAVAERTSRGLGCIYCSGRSILRGFNDLATTHPRITEEWHPTKNGIYTPQTVTSKSLKLFWWKGNICGHEWKSKISDRVKSNFDTACPYCSNRKILLGFNDLATTRKDIAKDWHPTKNPKIKSTDVTKGSNTYVWWLGVCGHEWRNTVISRIKGSGCPECSLGGSSGMERSIFLEIKKSYPDAKNGEKLLIPWGKISFASVDILIPSLKTVIEYDGSYWHAKRFETDTLKTHALIEAGYQVIRIRQAPLDNLDIKNENLIQITHKKETPATMATLVTRMVNQKGSK